MKIVEVYKEYYSVVRDTLPLEKRVYLDDVVPDEGRYYLVFDEHKPIGGYVLNFKQGECILLSGMFSLMKKRDVLSIALKDIDSLPYGKEYIIISCIGDALRGLYTNKGFSTSLTLDWNWEYAPQDWYKANPHYEPNIYYMIRKVGYNEFGL